MKVTNKTYRVWKVLFTIPNRWVDVMEVAYESNLTTRQVSMIINGMPSPPVEKERDGDGHMQVILRGSEDELSELSRNIKKDCYGISEETLSMVEGLVPTDWIPLNSLCDITGIDRSELTKILSVIKGVECHTSSKTTEYRRICEV